MKKKAKRLKTSVVDLKIKLGAEREAALKSLPKTEPEGVAPVEGQETEEDRLRYYRDYNATHRETLLDRKKSRYKHDADYRSKILTAAKKRYEDKKKQPAKTSEHCRVCPMCQRPLPRVVKPTLMRVDGGPMKIKKKFEIYMFTIGELASRLKRQQRTIKAWIRLGVIPESRYRNAAGRRLWTLDQLELIQEVAGKYNLRPPVNYREIGFVDEIAREWKKLMPLGIDVDRYDSESGGYYRRKDLPFLVEETGGDNAAA